MVTPPAWEIELYAVDELAPLKSLAYVCMFISILIFPPTVLGTATVDIAYILDVPVHVEGLICFFHLVTMIIGFLLPCLPLDA